MPEFNIKPLDAMKLVRTVVYTDNAAGDIMERIPVDLEGNVDPVRQVSFLGSCTLYTAAGPIPVEFPLEAKTLKDAFMEWEFALKKKLDEMKERAASEAAAARLISPSGKPLRKR